MCRHHGSWSGARSRASRPSGRTAAELGPWSPVTTTGSCPRSHPRRAARGFVEGHRSLLGGGASPRSARGRLSRTLGLLALAAIAACSAGESRGTWAGTIDTLPSGTIVVSNPATGIWDSATAWRLEEDLRIGTPGEGPASFSTVAGLEVDRWGRIYAIDRDAQEIRVFDSTGAYLRTIGRKGKGPGEFVGANGVAWDPRGRLWVVDQQGERYTLFDTTGRVVEDHPRRLGFYGWRWGGTVDTAGFLYEDVHVGDPSEGRSVLLRMPSDLTRRDSFPLPRYEGPAPFLFARGGGRTFMSVPYSPGLIWSVDAGGHVWFAFSDVYRVYQRRPTGDTVRIIERAAAPIPVTATEEDSVVAAIVKRVGPGTNVDRSRIPKMKPAFRTFWIDDAGRLWVLVTTPAGAPRQTLDVFAADGRYLGGVPVPFTISPYSPVLFRAGRVYAATEAADGVPYVVRARVVRGGGS